MIELYIAAHPMEPERLDRLEAENVVEALRSRYPVWPSGAKLYDISKMRGSPSVESLTEAVLSAADVTPTAETVAEDVEALLAHRGPFLLVLAPADPITAIIAVVAVALGVAAAVFLMPKVPSFNNQFESPNNTLSDRQNKPRPGARIPDIFGRVRSTPDLLAVPYKFFENHVEIEIAYMCVGRGSYLVEEIKDGDTPLELISGTSAIVYGPNTSPNSGTPQLEVGSSISEPVYSVRRSNDVNGQTLRPPNSNYVSGDDNIRFVSPDTIEASGGIDFTDFFDTDDEITVGGASFSVSGTVPSTYALAKCTLAGTIVYDSVNPSSTFSSGDEITLVSATFAGEDGSGNVVYVDLSGTYTIDTVNSTTITLVSPELVNPEWDNLDNFVGDETPERFFYVTGSGSSSSLDLSGTYTVLSVSSNEIVLSNPALVNGDWADLASLPGSASPYISPSISTSGERWVGPFTIQLSDTGEVLANFVAQQGLYKISNKNKQIVTSVSVLLEVTPADEDGTPLGSPETFSTTVVGSDNTKQMRAQSLFAALSYSGAPAVNIRARRTTPEDLNYDGTVVDEIKWRDAYALSEVYEPHFGDVTTVHTKTYATASATSVKERKLSLSATRKLPERDVDGELTGSLVASSNFDDILSAMATDPFIGRRTEEEVDFLQIRGVGDAVEAYFGVTAAREFGYTFDDDNISFEESAALVADASFCRVYRLGSVIQIAFEDAGDDASLLFNHRNILPRSQVNNVRFGPLDDQDGLELDYTSSPDGAKLTYQIPPSGSPVAPRRLSPAGVSSQALAYWHAWRNYNKMQYQNVNTELEATQEASLVRPPDRVMITDQTRAGSIEGEVVDEDGLHLLLSQPADLSEEGDYYIFLQHIDATVESLPVGPRTTDLAGIESAELPYWVTLGSAPRLPLAVDPLLFGRAKFEIAEAGDLRSRLFLVTEREPESNFTESVRAINYSFLYYMNDQLQLWLPAGLDGLLDRSAYRRHPAPSGTSPTLSSDSGVNQQVIVAAGAGNHMDVTLDLPGSYSVAAVVKSVSGMLFQTASASVEFDSGDLIVTHGAGSVSVELGVVSWTPVLISYDADEQLVRVYTLEEIGGGALVNHSGDELDLLKDFSGRLFDLRVWPRALTRSEALEVNLSALRKLI